MNIRQVDNQIDPHFTSLTKKVNLKNDISNLHKTVPNTLEFQPFISSSCSNILSKDENIKLFSTANEASNFTLSSNFQNSSANYLHSTVNLLNSTSLNYVKTPLSANQLLTSFSSTSLSAQTSTSIIKESSSSSENSKLICKAFESSVSPVKIQEVSNNTNFLNAFEKNTGRYVAKVTPPPPPLYLADKVALSDICLYSLSKNSSRNERLTEAKEQSSKLQYTQSGMNYYDYGWNDNMYLYNQFPYMPNLAAMATGGMLYFFSPCLNYFNNFGASPFNVQTNFQTTLPQETTHILNKDNNENKNYFLNDKKSTVKREVDCKVNKSSFQCKNCANEVFGITCNEQETEDEEENYEQQSERKSVGIIKYPKYRLNTKIKRKPKINIDNWELPNCSNNTYAFKNKLYNGIHEMSNYYTHIDAEADEDIISLLLLCRKLEKEIEEQHNSIDMLESDLLVAQEKLKYPPEWRKAHGILEDFDLSNQNFIPSAELPIFLNAKISLKNELSNEEEITVSNVTKPKQNDTAKIGKTFDAKELKTATAKNPETATSKNLETATSKNLETATSKNLETATVKNPETVTAKRVENKLTFGPEKIKKIPRLPTKLNPRPKT